MDDGNIEYIYVKWKSYKKVQIIYWVWFFQLICNALQMEDHPERTVTLSSWEMSQVILNLLCHHNLFILDVLMQT
jgi:hypothetical protein